MKLSKLVLAGTALVAVSGVSANASIIDNPHFKVLGMVIVWGADSDGTAKVASDFIIDTATGSGDTDLIAGDVHTVVTGSLSPTPDAADASFSAMDLDGSEIGDEDGDLDADDSFSAFDVTTASIDAAPEFNSSFYVASNTAFAIDAAAETVGTPVNFGLDDIGFGLGVTVADTDGTLAFGGKAQDPGGSFPTVSTLNDMSSSTNVYTGALRTAKDPGSIAAQSVRFDATYKLGGDDGYDMSMGDGEIEAKVTYTVYVP